MIVKGKSLMLRVNGVTIALATNCNCNLVLQTIDARTKDDAGAYDVADIVTFTMSSESLVGMSKSTLQLTHARLFALMLAKEPVDVEVMLAANARFAVPDSDWQPGIMSSKGFQSFCGQALIKSIDLSAPLSGNSTMSIQLSGVGELTPVADPELTSYVEGSTLYINGPAEIVGNSIVIEGANVNDEVLEL